MNRKNINWDQIFQKRADSKLSDAAFCRQENVSIAAFYKQKQCRGLTRPVRRSAHSIPNVAKPDLLELDLGGRDLTPSNPTIRLTNPNGITIEVYL